MLKSRCNVFQLVNFITHGVKFQRVAFFSSETNPCLADYLVGSLGFSTQQSLATSSKLSKMCLPSGKKNVTDFNFAENANSVVTLLKQHGFDETHVRKIVYYDPRFLTAKVGKSLKPKLQLLQDLGFCGTHLVNLVSGNPRILRQRLGPAIQALKDVMGSDDNVALFLKQSKGVYLCYVTKNLRCNVALLENEYGIPKDKYLKHIVRHPNLYVQRPDSFQSLLTKVENKLGIPRHFPMFLYGCKTASSSDKNFETKFRVFKSFGWSQSHVMQLIRLHPCCLHLSAARIKDTLEVLMNKVGYEPADLVSRPTLLTYSIDKRILPRHSILVALKKKGLIRNDYPLHSCIHLNDCRFLERFVLPFAEVHDIYAKETGCTAKVHPTKLEVANHLRTCNEVHESEETVEIEPSRA